MNSLAVGAIGLYQRHISPYKGFRCAKRAASGGWSCSEFGKRAFARLPVAKAMALLRRRLDACRTAYEGLRRRSALAATTTVLHAMPAGEREDEQGTTEAKEKSRKRDTACNTLDACDCTMNMPRLPSADCASALPTDACAVDLALPCDCGL